MQSHKGVARLKSPEPWKFEMLRRAERLLLLMTARTAIRITHTISL
jgi:hypothetical protein